MTKFAGRTILVVEDEVIALDLVKSIEDAGGRAVAASTAKAGLALIQSTGISAAVVDRKLGDEDSANLCERLSAAEIPFVIYTGYPDASNAWPHAPFLSKPTRPQDILAAIARVLPDVRPDVSGELCECNRTSKGYTAEEIRQERERYLRR
jgi:DNA-binding NtrC family response regulator